MKAACVICLLALAATASAQSINVTAIESMLSGYTGGSLGKPSDNYLTSLASTLASGFISSVGGVINNVTDFVSEPSSYKGLLDSLEAEFCEDAFTEESEKIPAEIVGPTVDLIFSGGACLLDETTFLKGDGDLTVNCVAPSVEVNVWPATITAPHQSAIKTTDKECKVERSFGEETDNVVYILDQGLFNMTDLVNRMTTGLTSVLGEFSSLTGAVVSAPEVAPILSAVNTATALLG